MDPALPTGTLVKAAQCERRVEASSPMFGAAWADTFFMYTQVSTLFLGTQLARDGHMLCLLSAGHCSPAAFCCMGGGVCLLRAEGIFG